MFSTFWVEWLWGKPHWTPRWSTHWRCPVLDSTQWATRRRLLLLTSTSLSAAAHNRQDSHVTGLQTRSRRKHAALKLLTFAFLLTIVLVWNYGWHSSFKSRREKTGHSCSSNIYQEAFNSTPSYYVTSHVKRSAVSLVDCLAYGDLSRIDKITIMHKCVYVL